MEITQAHLDRIGSTDQAVHAFLHVDTDGALAQAADVDARRAKGDEPRPAGRRTAGAEGRADAGRRTDHGRFEDPRGLEAAVRLDRGEAVEGGRHRDPRQDQHGRVRDGLVDRELGVRNDPQPVGPQPDPRWLRWRLVGCHLGVPGSARDRHRHGWLDPSAGRVHGHRGRQADVRRHLAVRADRTGLQPGHARSVCPDDPRRGAAARGDRRLRPDGLHLDQPAGTGRCRCGSSR